MFVLGSFKRGIVYSRIGEDGGVYWVWEGGEVEVVYFSYF